LALPQLGRCAWNGGPVCCRHLLGRRSGPQRHVRCSMRSRNKPLRPAEVGGQAVRAARFWDRFYAATNGVQEEPDDVPESTRSPESAGSLIATVEAQPAEAACTEWISDPNRLLPLLLEAVQDRLPSTVLEIGCGDSSLAAQLYDALEGRAAVTAIDISEVALARSREAFCGPRPGLRFLHADATNLEGLFANATLDLVVDKGMADTLQFRAKTKQSRALRRALFAEVFRVLTPGGVYVMTTPKFSPRYLHTVPWASVSKILLGQPEGLIFDLSGHGGDEMATAPAKSAYVHVCHKPLAELMASALG